MKGYIKLFDFHIIPPRPARARRYIYLAQGGRFDTRKTRLLSDVEKQQKQIVRKLVKNRSETISVVFRSVQYWGHYRSFKVRLSRFRTPLHTAPIKPSTTGTTFRELWWLINKQNSQRKLLKVPITLHACPQIWAMWVIDARTCVVFPLLPNKRKGDSTHTGTAQFNMWNSSRG